MTEGKTGTQGQWTSFSQHKLSKFNKYAVETNSFRLQYKEASLQLTAPPFSQPLSTVCSFLSCTCALVKNWLEPHLCAHTWQRTQHSQEGKLPRGNQVSIIPYTDNQVSVYVTDDCNQVVVIMTIYYMCIQLYTVQYMQVDYMRADSCWAEPLWLPVLV